MIMVGEENWIIVMVMLYHLFDLFLAVTGFLGIATSGVKNSTIVARCAQERIVELCSLS